MEGLIREDSTTVTPSSPPPPPPPLPLWQRIVFLASLIIYSVVLLAAVLVGTLANRTRATGFANKTHEIVALFYLQVTPHEWTFIIVTSVVLWQIVWMLYAWSFVFRSKSPCTISWTMLLLYTCSDISKIIWVFLWGNSHPQIAFPFVVLVLVFSISAIVVQVVHVYKLTPTLQTQCKYKIDLWITRLLVINGMVVYATYLTVGALLNFGVILQYFADVSPITTGAMIVWLATVTVLTYFALENTILKHFTRFILMVYPTLIWVLSGVLSAHWGQEDPNTNPVLTHLLLLLVIILFIARVSITVFPLLQQSLACSLQLSWSIM